MTEAKLMTKSIMDGKGKPQKKLFSFRQLIEIWTR